MYRLRCFGKTAVEEETGDEVLQLRSRKHLALLLYLLSHRQRTYPRERLASLFWDTEPRLARHSLSQALYDIRNSLPGIELETTASQVGAGDNGLVFDAEQFEDAVRSNDLSRAVRLYDGRFAPDLEDAGNSDFTRWVESERNRFRRLAEMALYRHVRECDDEAEWGEMCVSSLQLLEMNPLSEDAHRALMRGLWLQGDRAAAVRHFEESKAFLRRELPGGISQETLELVQRIRSSRPNVTSPGEAGEMRPQMVGRKEEFETLKGALRRLREDGKGGLVRIHGEAGMGKTRLLEEFRELTALDGVRLLESRCYAAESDVPYGPVVDGLDDLATEAGDGDGERAYYQLGHLFPSAFDRPGDGRESFSEPDVGRRRLYEEAADLLRCAVDAEPVVWTVEDVHWIDPSSASLLHYVARRLADSPLLLVLTSRTHEDAAAATEELLQDTNDSLGRVDDLELGPLNRDEVARLIRTVDDSEPSEDAVRRVHTLAGGNPFYALELLRSSDMDRGLARPASQDKTSSLITESLRTVLKRRLRGVTAKGLRILETVAVAGRHATPAVVSRAAGLPTDELADLSAGLYDRGLLRDQDGKLEFHHDITREFVYGNMGDLQRSALHLSVGQLLEARGREADAGTLARHFEVGDDPERAYEYALEAARDAERRHAHEEAIQMAEMAVGVAADKRETACALRLAAESRLAIGEFAMALDNLRTLLADDYPLRDNEGVEIRILLASASLELGLWDQAIQHLKSVSGPDASASIAHRSHLAAGLYEWVKAAIKANQPSEAAQAARAVKQTSDIGDREVQTNNIEAPVDGYNLLSIAAYELFCHSAQEGLKVLNTLKGLDDRLPYDCLIKYYLLRTIAMGRLGRWYHAEAAAKAGLGVSSSHNDLHHQAVSLGNLVVCYFERGRWAEALDYQQQTTEVRRTLNNNAYAAIPTESNAGDIAFFQGNLNRARALLERNLKYATDVGDLTGLTTEIRAGLGLIAAQEGRRADAERLHEEIGDIHSWELSQHCGVQDRYKVAWLEAYRRWGDSPESATNTLHEAVSEEKELDIPGAAKLRYLRKTFQAISEEQGPIEGGRLRRSQEAEQLRSMDMTWFVHMARRWSNRALQTSRRKERTAG